MYRKRVSGRLEEDEAQKLRGDHQLTAMLLK